MGNSNNLNTQDCSSANIGTICCENRFKLINQFKKNFGDRFDDLDFVNFQTGKIDIKGSALRDAQTGCELNELQGWYKPELYKCGCIQFDEQLLFVSNEGEPLSNTDYRVTLGDGRTVSGTTDNKGKTKRIKNTQTEQSIEKVEFFASEKIQPLCPKNRVQPGKLVKEVKLAAIKTTRENVGSSVKHITIEGSYRRLTYGETRMCIRIFKDAINYSKVKIHNKSWLPFNAQVTQTGSYIVTPNGELYAPDSAFKEDYSEESINNDDKMWFLHEMTHVWQFQLGYDVKAMGLLWQSVALSSEASHDIVYKYDNPKYKDNKFWQFNMEQQAEILSHYYGAKYLRDNKQLPKIPFLERVMDNFLDQPLNKRLLPSAGYEAPTRDPESIEW